MTGQRIPQPGDVVRYYAYLGSPVYMTGIVKSGVLEHPVGGPHVRVEPLASWLPIGRLSIVDDPIEIAHVARHHELTVDDHCEICQEEHS